MEMEEHARVIDFMPDGRSSDREREPTAQLVGERYFTLLEVAIKRETPISLGQKLYIGKDARAEVEKIKTEDRVQRPDGNSQERAAAGRKKHHTRPRVGVRGNVQQGWTHFNQAAPA